MRWGSLVNVCWIALFLLFGAGAATASPNVILILTDDQGWGDLGVHGNETIDTPVLDQFAREGVDFTRYYSSPVCAPTRASLMTGRYYYRTGVIHTSRGGAKMAGEAVTLAEMLSTQGYVTGIFGKWHLGDSYPMRPMDQGFQVSLVHKSGGIGQTPDRPNHYQDPILWHQGNRGQYQGYCTDVFFDAAIDFIEHQDLPFFVYLATNAPHTPLEVDSRYVKPFLKKGLDDTTARVYGMVKNIDENVGRLLEFLDRTGRRDETLVLFVGDNGPQQSRYNGGLRGRKSSVYEGGIRSLCLLQYPAQVNGGRTVDHPIAHIDIAPTILDLVKSAIDEYEFDGVSVLPLLRGASLDVPDRELYFQCHRGLTPTLYQNAAVVGRQYKLVMNSGTFSDEAFSVGQTGIGDFGLYDLTTDSAERLDLSPAFEGRVQAMVRRYRDWFADVRSTRRFEPGRVIVGSDSENPIRLCRYQDGQYLDGFSQGWPIQVARGGLFRIRVIPPESWSGGHLFVSWQGQCYWRPCPPGQAESQVRLSSGTGLLDVWIQGDGEIRRRPGNNSIVGDVFLERLNEALSEN